MEDQSNSRLAVWLQPSDLQQLAASGDRDLNTMIQEWKDGIVNIIFKRIFDDISEISEEIKPKNILSSAESLIATVFDIFSTLHPGLTDSVSKGIFNNFLNNKEITVYIDDLDRGWEAHSSDIRRISALLNAIRDLAGNRTNLKFRLGLRSDVYSLVRTSDESTDKIEQNIIWLTWSNHEILSVMAKRIETFFGKTVDEKALRSLEQFRIARYLDSVIVKKYQGVGKWENAPTHRILLSLTRKRPRDLVKLLSGAAREAHKNGRSKIATIDLRNTFESYSGERLQDIINEFRSEFPDIQRLLHSMRPTTKERRPRTVISTQMTN